MARIPPELRGQQPAHPTCEEQCDGLTVREYMATHMLAGLLSTSLDGWSIQDATECAVRYTDALLAALAAQPED